MVKHSSGRADENVNALLELSNLIINIDSAVDCNNFKLVIIVLKLGHFIGHLQSQLTSRRKPDGLNLAGP